MHPPTDSQAFAAVAQAGTIPIAGRLCPPRRPTWLALVAVVLAGATAAAPDAAAAELDNPRAEALRTCNVEREQGRPSEARRCYQALIQSGAPAWVLAEAYWAAGGLEQANAAFRRAVAAAPEDPDLRARWGMLYLQTHQPAEAGKLFDEALDLAPEHLVARLGKLRAKAELFEPGVRRSAEALGQAYPEEPAVQLLVARLALEGSDVSAATAALDRVEASLKARNRSGEGCGPQHLELYALRASVALLADGSAERFTKRALACNARDGAIYAIPAHFYGMTRRYREATELLEHAVEVEPERFDAHAELAINLMRLDRDDEARQHFEIAYRGDPYSAQVVNSLRLLDSLAAFRRIAVFRTDNAESSSGTQAADTEASAALILRLHQDESDLLAPYARRLALRAIDVFGRNYQHTLQRPVVVELYPNHEDFAVRTVGLPGLGLLGATFGHVVAMDSPSARKTDENFIWGSVLWHELAHVFTLEASDHRVSRWFSEGISVYEEWESGPLRQPDLPLDFIAAVREDRLLPVLELEGGFMHPSYPGQVAVSYTQAGWLCRYIAQRFGSERFVGILRGYARGLDTATVLRRVLGVEPAELDRGFVAFVRERAGRMAEPGALDAWRSAMRAASEAIGRSDFRAAIEPAEEALEIYPDGVRGNSPYLLLARAREALGEREGAIEALEQYRARGGSAPAALEQLAGWLHDAGRRQQAVEILGQLLYVAPDRPPLHERLAEWLLEDGRPQDAAAELEVLLTMNPHDRAAIHLSLARAYHRAGNRSKARIQLLQALEIAPHFRQAQRLLLEIQR